MTSRSLVRLLSFVSFLGVLAIPAAAQQYRVTVTLLGETSIPAPLSYSFDTGHPFQTTDVSDITNLSVTFDSQCGSNCSFHSGAVDYNANETDISYTAFGTIYKSTVGCTVWLFDGNCSVGPGLNITTAGVTYGGASAGGTVAVTSLAVPESSSYIQLSGFGLLGLALCFSRRFFVKKIS